MINFTCKNIIGGEHINFISTIYSTELSILTVYNKLGFMDVRIDNYFKMTKKIFYGEQ